MCIVRASVSGVFYLLVGRGLPNSGAVSSIAEICRRRLAPPTPGVTFDLGYVLVLAWEELRDRQCQLMR